MDTTERARIIEKAAQIAYTVDPVKDGEDVVSWNDLEKHGYMAIRRHLRATTELQLTAIGYFEMREALEPFVDYASGLPLESFAGEIGEYYRDGLRVSIKYENLRRASAALKKGE